MKLNKLFLSLAAITFSLSVSLAYADAPIEDLSAANPGDASMNQAAPDNSDAQPAANATDDQQYAAQAQQQQQQAAPGDDRLSRLEQQVSNMTGMNMPQQIEQLRQEVQELNGRIQVQQHDIELLKSQQREFYKDLNSRMQQMNAPQASSTGSAKKALAATAGASSTDSAAYRSAFNMLMKKQYDDAMSAFQDYLNGHPKGAYVPNAYYWMGELYLKRQDTAMALKSFNRIVDQYPNSNKVPDAKLKLAIIHMSQGKKDQAQQELNAIKRQYPNSTAAQLASIQLQRLAQ